MSNVIDLGKARSNFGKEKPWLMSARERVAIEFDGTRAQRRELQRLEAKERFRFGPQEETKMNVTIRQLNHPHFISAMQKLDNCSHYPSPQTAWNVMKLMKKCHELIRENRELYQKTTKNYAQVDEKGEIKVDERGQILYKDEEAEKAHQAEFEKFMEVEVEISAKLLNLNDLQRVNLAPSELEALEPFIDPTTVE